MTTIPGHPTVVIVGAVADGHVAGANGSMPWHAPDDLRHFRDLTLGYTIIMGQRTWNGLAGPLPQRRNIVLSNDATLRAEGAVIARTMPQALAAAGDGPVFVIGGRQPWEEAMDLATKIHLTRIHAHYPGDVLFPPIDAATWAETARQYRTGLVDGVPTRIEFLTYARRDIRHPRSVTGREQP
ncbi:dihydrofolate reductase [Actinoplanes sp. NPDC026619]|uniref:dihydrofolate reductase n=1 Tax=Actinoplanes sp. NPDC026619 TaxID=3155798 RepID=UPI0033CFD358